MPPLRRPRRPAFRWRFCTRTFSTRTLARARSTARARPCLPLSAPVTTCTRSPLRMRCAMRCRTSFAAEPKSAYRCPVGTPPSRLPTGPVKSTPRRGGLAYPGTMARWIGRAVVTLGGLTGVALGACFFWPDRFAVNVPIRNAVFGTPGSRLAPELLGSRIHVPDGLSIGLFAELPRVRGLRATPSGDLLASVPREGRVALLERDPAGDGRADGARTLLSDLNRPHGLELYDGWLYVGETDAVGGVRFDAGT